MARGNKQGLSAEELLEQALVPEDKQPYEVPANWVWVTGKIAFGNMESTRPSGDFFKYIDIDAIDNKNLRVLEPKTIAVTEAPSRASRKVNEGDTLFSLVRPYLRNIAYIDSFHSDCIASSGFYVCHPNKIYNTRFIYYLMSSEYVVNGLNAYMKGDNSPSIRKDDIEKFAYPLPPLAEQQRIVDRIESLFARLDRAKEMAQNVLDSFETRKASILHKAFKGELTAKWREEQGIGLDSWEEKSFMDFCYLNRGFDLPANQREAGPFPLASSSGIIDSHIVAKVKGPGVVTGRSGSIGKVFYIEDDFWPLNTTLYSKNMYNNVPKFVYYYLLGFDFKQFSSSTAVPTLNRNNFTNTLVNIPTIHEQKEIVRILDQQFEREQQAKAFCQAINQIDLMKKAILAIAFRGKLGTNDPRKENSLELLKELVMTQ